MARPLDPVERISERLARLPLVRPQRPESLPVPLDRRRVYILPTAFGLFLAVMLLTMLVGGLNYNNNPALLLAFVVMAIAHNSLVHAHLTLSGVRLIALHAEPVHAGRAMQLRFAFDAAGRRHRPGLELRLGDDEAFFDLSPGERTEVVLPVPTVRRGWLPIERLRLCTVRPFGLARAWCWLKPDTRLLVYPTPEAATVPLPDLGGDGQATRSRSHGEQPHQLREYRQGDALRQVAWKASARADRLMVREYESTSRSEIELDWFSLGLLAHEARISRLTRWVLEAERQDRRFSLRLPAVRLGPASGPEHRHACLRALALMPDG